MDVKSEEEESQFGFNFDLGRRFRFKPPIGGRSRGGGGARCEVWGCEGLRNCKGGGGRVKWGEEGHQGWREGL